MKLSGNKCIFIFIHLMITNIQDILHCLWCLTAAFCLCRVVVCVCVQRMFVTRWNSAQTYKHQEHRTSNMKTSNWLSCQIQPSKRNFTVCVQPIFRCCPNFIFKNGHWTSLYHKAIFQPCEKMSTLDCFFCKSRKHIFTFSTWFSLIKKTIYLLGSQTLSLGIRFNHCGQKLLLLLPKSSEKLLNFKMKNTCDCEAAVKKAVTLFSGVSLTHYVHNQLKLKNRRCVFRNEREHQLTDLHVRCLTAHSNAHFLCCHTISTFTTS